MWMDEMMRGVFGWLWLVGLGKGRDKLVGLSSHQFG